METPLHLGGHLNVTHIDIKNLIYLKEKYEVKKMIDIGCGPGGMINEALKLGIDCIGIDGDPKLIQDTIIIHDFTLGKIKIRDAFDLAWSCEFVEHVEESFQENYMDAFSLAKHVVITFAPPGRKGHHHVNCRDEEYWINIFENYNFKYCPTETEFIRKNSSMNLDRPKKQFIQKNGLFFINQL